MGSSPLGPDRLAMKPIAVLWAPALLVSCALHVHLHESPTAAELRSPEMQRAATVPAGDVTGVVRDATGAPVRARVAAVVRGGSLSSGTDADGSFHLSGLDRWRTFVLQASTEDGRFAFRPGTHTAGEPVVLVVRPAATLRLELEGRAKARCAVFSADTRIEDFTLRRGHPAVVVVPPGELSVRLYDGEIVHAEGSALLACGGHEELAFQLDG